MMRRYRLSPRLVMTYDGRGGARLERAATPRHPGWAPASRAGPVVSGGWLRAVRLGSMRR